jgi:hypothetical protein
MIALIIYILLIVAFIYISRTTKIEKWESDFRFMFKMIIFLFFILVLIFEPIWYWSTEVDLKSKITTLQSKQTELKTQKILIQQQKGNIILNSLEIRQLDEELTRINLYLLKAQREYKIAKRPYFPLLPLLLK